MIKGIGVASGISIGKALIYNSIKLSPGCNTIKPGEIEQERSAVFLAIKKARAELERLWNDISDQKNDAIREVLEVHLELLEDPAFLKSVDRNITEGLRNAVDAVLLTTEEFVAMFRSLEDEYYAARTIDIQDVGNRIARCIYDESDHVDLSELGSDVILFADDLTPTETIRMNREHVLAFVTKQGSSTSHTAILARSWGIPAVVGVDYSVVANGNNVIVDGEAGTVIISPTPEQLAEYQARQAAFLRDRQRLNKLQTLPAITKDGRQVELCINIAAPKDAAEPGVDGIGLFRTEFLFMDCDVMPDEDKQYLAYKEAAARARGKPITIRTLDIGGDKNLNYLSLSEEANPFLGCRAIRLCLEHQELFRTQLRAILRAGVMGNIKIMFPMICNLEELLQAKQLLATCEAELSDEGIDHAKTLKVGMMVETPAAALNAYIFASEVDFFSIGTNDLCQYALAADRMNPKVAHLCDPFHPGVLRLIKATIEGAHAAHIPCGMCGEMAADPRAVLLLLGMGLDEFSITATAVPNVKEIIRSCSIKNAKRIYDQVITFATGGEIKQYLEEMLHDL